MGPVGRGHANLHRRAQRNEIGVDFNGLWIATRDCDIRQSQDIPRSIIERLTSQRCGRSLDLIDGDLPFRSAVQIVGNALRAGAANADCKDRMEGEGRLTE